MSTLSLHEINAAVEDAFGDFTINMAGPGEPEDVIAFRYFLRADKSARAKLAEGIRRTREPEEEGADDEAGELLAVLQAALEALAVKPAHFAKLKKAIGDDLVMWSFIVQEYGNRYEQAGQVGEA